MDFTGERFIPKTNLGSEIEIEHIQRYRAILDLVANKIVLDAASGAGYGSRILADSAKMVCGIEIDTEAILQAKDLYGCTNLMFAQGSVGLLPFRTGTFDLVISFETIEHLPAALQKEFLQEIKRVLKPDGLLVMSTPDRRIYSDLPGYHNEYHLKEFYREEFTAFLGDSFGQVKIWEQVALLSYLIGTGDESSLRHIPIPGRSVSLQGKYLIALCSDGALSEVPLGCITLDCDGLHQQKIDRVVELQGEIEGKNQDIKNVWDEVHKRDATIAAMAGHTQNLEKDIAAITASLNGKQQVVERLLADLTTCQAAAESAEQGQRKAEAQLEHICRTKAWSFIQKMYRLKNLLWHG